MSDFPLIQSLQEKNDKTALPKGHLYEKLAVVVENEEIIVHIPKREIENFSTMCNEGETLDKYTFNKIMRKVRGIRG